MHPTTLYMLDDAGNSIQLRRCGALPDLFAAEDGRIYKFSLQKEVSAGNGTAVRYKATTLSVRCLVADAWLPDWDQDCTGLEHIDGDRTNSRASNLRPTKGFRGRPPGSELRRQALLYQSFLALPDLSAVADAFGVTRKIVAEAVRVFDPDALEMAKPLPQPPENS